MQETTPRGDGSGAPSARPGAQRVRPEGPGGPQTPREDTGRPLGAHREDTLGPVPLADPPQGGRRGWPQGGTEDPHQGHGAAVHTAGVSPHMRPRRCPEGDHLQDVGVKAQETQGGPAFSDGHGAWVPTGQAWKDRHRGQDQSNGITAGSPRGA